jgi:hypothetical protein
VAIEKGEHVVAPHGDTTVGEVVPWRAVQPNPGEMRNSAGLPVAWRAANSVRQGARSKSLLASRNRIGGAAGGLDALLQSLYCLRGEADGPRAT